MLSYYALISSKNHPNEFASFSSADKDKVIPLEQIYTNERSSVPVYTEDQVMDFQKNRGKGWEPIVETGVTYTIFKIEIPEALLAEIIKNNAINKNDAFQHSIQFKIAAKSRIFTKDSTTSRNTKRLTLRAPIATPAEVVSSTSNSPSSAVSSTDVTQHSDDVCYQFRWLMTNMFLNYLTNHKLWKWKNYVDKNSEIVVNQETSESQSYLESNKKYEQYDVGEMRAQTYMDLINLYYPDYRPEASTSQHGFEDESLNLNFSENEYLFASNLALLAVLTTTGGKILTSILLNEFVKSFPTLDLTEEKSAIDRFLYNPPAFISSLFQPEPIVEKVPSKTKIKEVLLRGLFQMENAQLKLAIENAAKQIDAIVLNSKITDVEQKQVMVLNIARQVSKLCAEMSSTAAPTLKF